MKWYVISLGFGVVAGFMLAWFWLRVKAWLQGEAKVVEAKAVNAVEGAADQVKAKL